jgi:hypothetical protein
VARTEEVIVGLDASRDGVGLASHVRSTLLLSSVQSLRAKGLFDRYATHLQPADKDALLNTVAGMWMPMSLGMSHYRACEALGLSLSDATQLGHDVGNRVQGSLLGVLMRAAKGSGVTPWTVLGQIGRLWDRTFQGGGGASLTKLGPKEARAELIGLPLMAVPYFRHAYRGAFIAALELFCEKVYVTEVHNRQSDVSGAYRISWV